MPRTWSSLFSQARLPVWISLLGHGALLGPSSTPKAKVKWCPRSRWNPFLFLYNPLIRVGWCGWAGWTLRKRHRVSSSHALGARFSSAQVRAPLSLCPALPDTSSPLAIRRAHHFTKRCQFWSHPKAEEEGNPCQEFGVWNNTSYIP